MALDSAARAIIGAARLADAAPLLAALEGEPEGLSRASCGEVLAEAGVPELRHRLAIDAAVKAGLATESKESRARKDGRIGRVDVIRLAGVRDDPDGGE